jgi:phage FluMu gp28-like protein
MKKRDSYFLPYQQAWLDDESDLKIWEKTRRGGMTYVQSYEDVRDAVKGKFDVWFSSADDTAAREYILYCEKWATLFKEAAKAFNEIVFSEGKAIQVYSIRFASGKRITALSSNPSQFRSKGGKVILDEFAFHKDADAMWAAAEPVTTWGFPIRILSSHNGKNSRFFKLIEQVKSGELKGRVHRTDINTAIGEGLLDKIKGRPTTERERTEWVEDKKKRVGSANFSQEYLAIPVDEQGALLSYTLIESCQEPNLLYDMVEQLKGEFFVGMDIARRHNLTVIWVAEKLGSRLHTRFVVTLKNTAFKHQFYALEKFLSHSLCRRACLDQTGIGEQLTEEAIEKFGRFRVEGVRFSAQTKETMAYQLVRAMEDRNFLIPKDVVSDSKLAGVIREDFHSIERETTAAGNVRLKATANEESSESHADYFWSAALCNHAATNTSSGDVFIESAGETKSKKILLGYL